MSKIADEQLFYLMSRGLSEEQAMGMVVNGFIEPITTHAADGVRRRVEPTDRAADGRLGRLRPAGADTDRHRHGRVCRSAGARAEGAADAQHIRPRSRRSASLLRPVASVGRRVVAARVLDCDGDGRSVERRPCRDGTVALRAGAAVPLARHAQFGRTPDRGVGCRRGRGGSPMRRAGRRRGCGADAGGDHARRCRFRHAVPVGRPTAHGLIAQLRRR